MMLIVLRPAVVTVISAVSGFDQFPHKVLHPSRQCRQPIPEIGSNRITVLRIVENPSNPPKDAIPVVRLRQCIAQPM
jgi:hypothetical protein